MMKNIAWLLKNLYIQCHSALKAPSHICQLLMTCPLNHPHTITDAGFRTVCADNKPDGPSLWPGACSFHDFPIRISNFDSSDHRTVLYSASVNLKWVQAHRRWQNFRILFTLFFFLHDRLVTRRRFQWYSWGQAVISTTESASCF